MPALASLLGSSTAKARKILQGLVAKGVAETVKRERQLFYRLRIKPPDPLSMKPLTLSVAVEPGEPKEGAMLSLG